jgi:hypothetical protein
MAKVGQFFNCRLLSSFVVILHHFPGGPVRRRRRIRPRPQTMLIRRRKRGPGRLGGEKKMSADVIICQHQPAFAACPCFVHGETPAAPGKPLPGKAVSHIHDVQER